MVERVAIGRNCAPHLSWSLALLLRSPRMRASRRIWRGPQKRGSPEGKARIIERLSSRNPSPWPAPTTTFSAVLTAAITPASPAAPWKSGSASTNRGCMTATLSPVARSRLFTPSITSASTMPAARRGASKAGPEEGSLHARRFSSARFAVASTRQAATLTCGVAVYCDRPSRRAACGAAPQDEVIPRAPGAGG
jgi:hypothetical protein